MSFFRYPGGKSKLKKQIIQQLNLYSTQNDLEYREPFFGGGSIGMNFLKDNKEWKNIWINDKDQGVSSLWTSLIQFPNKLKQKINEFVPSISKFDEFKHKLTNEEPEDIVEYGFMKLAIHQISYSGLGTKSGGPLGGRKKENIAGRGSTDVVKYPIDCRWSPKYICKKIDKLQQQLNNCNIHDNCCTNLDFVDVISDTNKMALIYLDPPYYVKGNDLYQHGFTENDHKRLSEELEKSNHFWVLSYDDCPEIRSLYQWADIFILDNVKYTITSLKDDNGERKSNTKSELLIYPKGKDNETLLY